MQSADLVFVRGRAWIDREIERISRGAYSHVAIALNDSILIEAQGFRKVGYQNIAKYRGIADIYRCDRLTAGQRQKIVQAAKNRIGERYDYALIALEYLRLTAGVIVPWCEHDRVICSTLVSDAYQDGAFIRLCPDVAFPTPVDEARSPRLRKVASI